MVRVILVLLIMMCGYAHVTDINRVFLLGNFEKDIVTKEEQKLYMETLQGFSQFLPAGNWIMLMLKTLYGNKQAAKRFWLLYWEYLYNYWDTNIIV